MTGEELRKRRQKMKLTQEQLAVALRRPVATIRNWEQDRYAIEMDGILRYLLRALDEDAARYGGDREGFLASLPAFLGSEDTRD